MESLPAAAFSNAGYAIAPDVLPDQAAEFLLRDVDQVPRSRAGARNLMRLPSVVAVAAGARLQSLASDALGGTAVPFKATLFDKSRGANWAVPWHQDTALPLAARCEAPGWGPFSTKAGVLHAGAPAWALERVVALRLHLDASGPDNGPLRVIAGSHRKGLLDAAGVDGAVHLGAPAECHVPRGGVLLMRPLIVHSSPKAARPDEPRRVLHIEYVDRLALAPGIHLAVV
jgi:ectoine hydroxylase-related dioxygenase (phytanoyl-CoA dioxygenase family)